MKGSLRLVLPATCVILGAVACGKPQPIVPSKPVPAGTVLFQFTKKVQGPLELTIDGVRVQVEQAKSNKPCPRLEISGLAQGRHHFVLLSTLAAFGPDQFDLELGAAKGEFKVLFAQQFQAVLYGTPEPAPAAVGIPGVRARLQP
jgi:hypothetical protein